MRHRGARHGFDLLELEDSQVREPSVKAEQWVVIRNDPNGRRVTGNGLIEHAAKVRTVDVFAADAESDDAAGEHIDDHKDPMGAEQYRLATKQIHAPEGCRWTARGR